MAILKFLFVRKCKIKAIPYISLNYLPTGELPSGSFESFSKNICRKHHKLLVCENVSRCHLPAIYTGCVYVYIRFQLMLPAAMISRIYYGRNTIFGPVICKV
jgi:hypothetical protein